MMKYVAAAAACMGMAVAPINEYVVVRSSLPEQVDANLIAFSSVDHREGTITWAEPGLGDWEWPILGYEIQISSAMTWEAPVAYASDDAYGKSDDGEIAYSPTVNWDTCPDGESGASLDATGVANLTPWDGSGCTLNAVNTATTTDGLGAVTTTHTIPGLAPDTVYYFRIRARNHDGQGAWSDSSYGMLTHSKPEQPYAPEIYQVSHETMTVLFDTPATTGTDDCADIATKADSGVASYLANEACTTGVSDAGPTINEGDDRDCMSTATAPCQTVGSGSPVTGFRLLISEGDSTDYVELKDVTTGLSLYPMTAGDADTDLLSEWSGSDHQFSYTIEGLNPSTVYNVVLAATNDAGESDASEAVTGTTLGRPNKPEPPTATAVGETTIELTWDATILNCGDAALSTYDSTVPLPIAGYTSLTNAYPNTPTMTTGCPLDNNVALTGFRLFASSYSILGTSNADGGSWEPARRGSLTDDSAAFVSSPLDTELPSDLSAEEWLELDVSGFTAGDGGFEKGSFTVDHLSQDTYYKFKVLFSNAVGDSAVSEDSEFFLTLEAPVDDLKMHSSPPCIYESGGPTTFVATSTGTNVFYKWQLPDGLQSNAHDVRQFGSVIAEGGAEGGTDGRCQTTDCSVMEFVLPSVAPQQQNGEGVDHDSPDSSSDFTLSLIGYNTRGQVIVSTEYSIQYCGCTDPWDPDYWDQATYHIPSMCEHETWDGADMTVIEGEFQYYQTFYEENTHSAQVIVRIDEGVVNLFASTESIPDPAMSSTYFHSEENIYTFYVLEVPYEQLHGSPTLYLAIQGADGVAFSRFSVIASTREFTRGRGERYTSGNSVSTVAGSEELRRTQLLNIEPQAFEIKTPYYDFFEYYFGRADNDMDVEIKVNCQLGCVNVYTSKIERFPSVLRMTDSYAGYWTSHNGAVCATDGQSVSTYATASFDGLAGIYGMVSFEQADADSDVIIGVSLRGWGNRAADSWEITASAVGDQASSATDTDSCSSAGDTWAALPDDLLAGTGGVDDTIFTNTVTSTELNLFGDALAGESETSDSIIGRSVKISVGGGPVVCATIYPDASVTSFLGELSLMHTIRPEETVETCMTPDGLRGDCSGPGAVSSERLLFASVQGAASYAVGDEQLNNEYTIEAKIYRYRIESNLLQPQAAEENGSRISIADEEDRRYSVVSLDNFNYYEVELNPAAYGITVELTLNYGSVELYTSKDKLPTQDPAGHDKLYGDVHGNIPCPPGHCTRLIDTEWVDALGAGEVFMHGGTYRIHLPYSEINYAHKYVFLGVLGVGPDSAYTISVTEYLFQDTQGAILSHDVEKTATLAPNQYSFFALYVGPMDEEMYVTERSHAGHRTGDLGTDPDTWGIDWHEPLVSTWIEQQQDEWDLDVDVAISGLEGYAGVVAYGSSREAFPSAERGYDVMSTDGTITVPHFTFSDKTVFISLFNSGTDPVEVSFTPRVLEMHQDHLTADSPADLSIYTCPGTTSCSGQGSCVDAKCYCDNGFLGDDCSIEAFSSAPGQPSIQISPLSGLSGNTAPPVFSGDDEVLVPFALGDIPAGSKVHVYVDGAPYPAKGANVLYYPDGGQAIEACSGVVGQDLTEGCQQIEIYGMAAGVLHTVELLLLSEGNIPLGTDMVDFKVNFAGGCSNGCSSNGVCHHGYCVCFDGFSGIDCSVDSETPADGFQPGEGFVRYNSELMEQERQEDAYISRLKLDANDKFLQMSDSKIASAHAAVVAKLNQFVLDNENDMTTLAEAQAAKAEDLHRKRDRITTTIQQMREESKRLKTANTEAYLETVRALHEGQRLMQNELDAKRLAHFQNMAVRHDEWVQIKEQNDFKLNQLRTANGPLVEIDDLEERVCTQDDMFRTSCTDVPASTAFVEQPGYESHQTIRSVGTCTPAEAEDEANDERRGYRCTCSTDAAGNQACVRVEVDGETNAQLYHDIPR